MGCFGSRRGKYTAWLWVFAHSTDIWAMMRWLLLMLANAPLVLMAADKPVSKSGYHMLSFDFFYRGQQPVGKLASEYLLSSGLGFGCHFQHEKGWLFGGNISYTFGNGVVNKNTLDALTTADGDLLAYNGGSAYLTEPRLGQRGIMTMGYGGYFWPRNKRLPITGWFVKGGMGYVDQRIYIHIPGNQVYQLDAEYKRGYDRLFSGMLSSIEVGLQYHDHKKNFINFQLSAECMPSLSKYRRGYDYASHERLPEGLQLMTWTALKFTWYIPKFLQSGGEGPTKEYQFR